MKIAIIVAGFPPKWLAGTEIATYNIAKHLTKLGHEVHVVTSLDKGLAKESTEEGFCVHRITAMRKPYVFTLCFMIPTFLAVRKINPDIVHAQSIPMGLCALLIRKLTSIPYVVYSRGELYLSWAFKTVISKQVFKNAGAVIALTDDMKKSISKYYNGIVYVIPNGIELADFANLNKENSRKKLNIADDARVVIFVGRFRPEKDVASLIKAMKIIMERNSEAKLFIVGEGKKREQLKELTNKLNLDLHVNFVGKVAHNKVLEYMIAADAFVLPSLSEGFPVTIPEAMASGLPIIATRVGGVPEIITNGENGLLIEPRNPEHIAKAILTILENGELATKISMNNRAKVRQYSWQNTAQGLEEVYTKVAEMN